MRIEQDVTICIAFIRCLVTEYAEDVDMMRAQNQRQSVSREMMQKLNLNCRKRTRRQCEAANQKDINFLISIFYFLIALYCFQFFPSFSFAISTDFSSHLRIINQCIACLRGMYPNANATNMEYVHSIEGKQFSFK